MGEKKYIIELTEEQFGQMVGAAWKAYMVTCRQSNVAKKKGFNNLAERYKNEASTWLGLWNFFVQYGGRYDAK